MNPLAFIQNFTWDLTKYHQGRSLVEIVGKATDYMKTIDSELKKLQDSYNEKKNELALYTKKDGTNLVTRDFTDEIHMKVNEK